MRHRIAGKAQLQRPLLLFLRGPKEPGLTQTLRAADATSPENPFQNWTRNNAQILGSVFLYVDYSMPLEPLRTHFEKVLSETRLWDGETQVLQVTDTTEKTMTIRMLMTAQNSPIAFDLRCYVREKMIEFIQQNYPESLPQVRASLTDSGREKGERGVAEQVSGMAD